MFDLALCLSVRWRDAKEDRKESREGLDEMENTEGVQAVAIRP